MTQEKAEELQRAWFARLDAASDMVLFETEEDGLPLVEHEKQWVRRSALLTSRLLEVKTAVKKAFKDRLKKRELQMLWPEGVCYFIYTRSPQGQVEPLYVGITQTAGKKKELNSLFTDWVRFAEKPGSNGHLGCLNEALLGAKKNYDAWVTAMFEEELLEGRRRLRKKVCVHVEVWDDTSISVVSELGHSPLCVEEMLRLWVLRSAGHGPRLLNRDGNRGD